MSSDIKNTGERYPIYESLWRCDIRDKSLYWDELQNYCWRRWWFGDRTSACREYTLLREDSNSRIYAAIPGQTIIGPVLQVHITRYLGISGIEIQNLSTTTKKRTSWVVICRWKKTLRGGVTSQWSRPQSHKFWVTFGKDLLQKKVNFVVQRWSNPASRKLMRRSSKFRRIQCVVQKKLFLLKKGSGMTFLPTNISKETLSKPKSQNWSWDWYVIMIKKKEKQTALFIGTLLVQNCEKAFQKAGRAHFLGLQYSKNSREVLLYIRAIQGHTGGNMTASELMGQIGHPHKWKEFLFHRGCSYNVTSILKPGLIAGGRESKEGRQTIFFTPLNRFGDNPDEEEPNDDLSKPRKVHYHSKWKPSQDAVYWTHLARARQRTTFLAKQIPCRSCIQPCAGRLHL